jgi:hypothetical protein
MSKEIALPQLTKPQAMKICEQIRAGLGSVSDLLVELHEGEGWKTLGYGSWKECCEKEFQHSAWWANRQLRVAEVRRALPPPQAKKSKACEIHTVLQPNPPKDSHLIELEKVPENQRLAVLAWAEEKADGKPLTAAMIRQAAKDCLKAEPDTEDEPPEEPAPPAPVLDALKRPVPENLKPVFENVTPFDEAMNLCTALTKALNTLRADDTIGIVFAGRGVASQALKDVSNVRHALKFSRPYAVCPYCKGKGCDACSEAGWVGEGVYRSAPEEKR